MASAMNAKSLVLDFIRDNEPCPLDLLAKLRDSVSYAEIQEALRLLLDAGEIELTSDRRLKIRRAEAVAS